MTKVRAWRGAGTPLGRRKLGAVVALGLVSAGPMLLDGATAGTALAVCIAAIVATLVIAGTERRLRIPPGSEPLMVALFVLVAWTLVQWLPMPCDMLGVLLPQDRTRFPRRVAELVGVAPTCRMTMDPGSTARAVLVESATLLAALVGASAARSLGRSSVLVAVAGSGVLVSLTTLLHMATSATRVFGLYEPAYSRYGLVGPLMNGNHLAALVTLAVPCCLAMMSDARKTSHVAASALGLAILVATGFEAHSRLGLLTMLFAAIGSIAILLRRRRLFERGSLVRTAAALVGGVSVAFAMAFIEGRSILADFVSSPYKVDLIRSALGFAFTSGTHGVGRGAFGAAFIEGATQQHRAMYPENLVAQWVSEMGIVVGPAMLVGFVYLLVRIVRRRDDVPTRLGALALFALLVHELGDFSTEMPGIRLVTSALLGGLAVSMRVHSDDEPRPRIAAAGVAAALVTAVAMTPFVVRADLDSERTRVETSWRRNDDAGAYAHAKRMVVDHPFDAVALTIAGEAALREGDARALAFTNLARLRAPRWSAPHETAYRVFARARRPAQALAELGRVAFLAPERAAALYCGEPARPLDPRRLSRALPRDERATQVLRELRRCIPEAQRVELLGVAVEERPNSAPLALEWLASHRAVADLESTVALETSVSRRFPRDAHVAVFVAQTYLLASRPQEALAAIEDARRRGLDTLDLLEVEARSAAAVGDEARVRRALAAFEQRRSGEDAVRASAMLRADCAAALQAPGDEIEALTAVYRLAPSLPLLERIESVGARGQRPSAVIWARHRRCEDFDRCSDASAPNPGSGGLERTGNALDTATTGSP